MVRIGLIGCGEHSEIGHAIPLARYKRAHPNKVELVAACDLEAARAQKFCAKHGFQEAYSNVDEMLASKQLDVCIMVVPTVIISGLGVKILKTGIPCVIEKPLGSTLAEVNALHEVAEITSTRNMVSVNRRFMPFLNRALEWTRSLGSIRYVHCTMARHARTEPQFLWETAVHAIDTLRYICGKVANSELRCMSTEQGAAASYAIDLSFANKAVGRVDVLPTAGMVEETYDLFGKDFRVTVTCPFGPQRGWRAFRDGNLLTEEFASADMSEDTLFGFYDEASALINALATGLKLAPTISDVAPSVELCMSLASNLNSRKS